MNSIIVKFSVLLIYIYSLSCTPEPDKQSNLSGEIKQEICIKDTSHTYQVFLPGDYSKSRKYPVIFCFDPHANGNIPVDSLKEIASERGYIIIGSNYIKNNLPDLNYALQILMGDVYQKFSINPKRIYTCGFSGGGRVASWLALQDDNVTGAITCGAGFPGVNYNELNKRLYLYGISGNEDFNYLEVLQGIDLQSVSNIEVFVDIFSGGHRWPGESILHDALLFFEFNAMKDGVLKRDKKLINVVYKDFQGNKNQLDSKAELPAKVKIIEKEIAFFKGLKNVKPQMKEREEIINSVEYKRFIQNENQVKYRELKLRQGYQQAFTGKSENWWMNEIEQLNKYIVTNDGKERSIMYERLLNYLSMLGFMYANKSLEDNDEINFKKYISIYEKVDPDNADVYYLLAKYYFQKGNRDLTVNNLKKCIELGFNDYKKIQNEFSYNIVQLIN